MGEIGVQEFNRSPEAAVRAAMAGEFITVTEGGLPVARLLPVRRSPLAELRAACLVREPRRSISELPAPRVGLALSGPLDDFRGDERY